MSIYSTQPLTFGGVKTYPLASRKSKVNTRDFAKPAPANASITKFLDSLPNLLAAQDLRLLLTAIHRARKQKAPILWGIGGHVIKVGLGPILIDLMRRGFISAIAMNGAALIHDFEIALAGNTSEDVEANLGAGQFGMASETGEYVNEFSKLAARLHIGYGEAAGQFLTSGILNVKHAAASVLVAAYKQRIPVTVHVAIGTDIPHMHPAADGPCLGAATFLDFRLFCALVKQMHPGHLFKLGLRRASSRNFSQSRERGPQSRRALAANHHRKFRLHPALSPIAKCSEASHRIRTRRPEIRIARLRHHRPSRTAHAPGSCRASGGLAKNSTPNQPRQTMTLFDDNPSLPT